MVSSNILANGIPGDVINNITLGYVFEVNLYRKNHDFTKRLIQD